MLGRIKTDLSTKQQMKVATFLVNVIDNLFDATLIEAFAIITLVGTINIGDAV